MRLTALGCLAGVAYVAVPAAALADELAALKAQMAALDARLAAIEVAPAAPQSYQLLAISSGELRETPGAPLTARERAAYGGQATFLSVLPAADAPAAASISWSGYARAGLVYNRVEQDAHARAYGFQDGAWVRDPARDVKYSEETHDTDVEARGQLLVQAVTQTSVGEVGAELELRADFNGNGAGDLYGKVVWGYWEMTRELTLAGGYNQSIADIVYGYDGSCTCYYTDNADVDFNPGDTTYTLLRYASGPVTISAAVEDASLNGRNHFSRQARRGGWARLRG